MSFRNPDITDFKNSIMNAPLFILPGEVPSPFNPPSGCRFNPRCSQANSTCRK
ncbi:MAG: oligopeptide/dipeptide ABC transporter ATP-binding protein [Thermodesulfobacteriota bacterium]